jgi:hypothetical protein
MNEVAIATAIRCDECGNHYPKDELVATVGGWVCRWCYNEPAYAEHRAEVRAIEGLDLLAPLAEAEWAYARSELAEVGV